VSIIIAYSPCIAHGVDLSFNLRQQDLAVKSGHWPLLRYDPRLRAQGRNPLSVDSAAPSIPYRDFAQHEARFTVLERLHPADANRLMNEAERLPAAATRNTPISPPWPCPAARQQPPRRTRMPDLTTRYLGLPLKTRSYPPRRR
jgi:pyruvate-ferredoxin/flavodoxin oxidoreductase